jgi:CheY-like chemotaxis protein
MVRSEACAATAGKGTSGAYEMVTTGVNAYDEVRWEQRIMTPCGRRWSRSRLRGMTTPDLRGAVVMVVEDHRGTLDMFEHVLRATGAKVIVAESGLKAVAILRRVLPSVIIVDIEMPEVDGFSFVGAARAVPATRHLPMIAMSGVPLDLHRQDWREAGFARALLKPVDPFVVCGIIAEMMDGAPMKRVADAVPMPRLRLGDLVTSISYPGWVGEIVDVTGARTGYVCVCWHTSSEAAIQSIAEPVANLVRLRAVGGGGGTSGTPKAMSNLRRSASASRHTSRRLRKDSGRLRLHARDLRELAAGLRAERRRPSVAAPR